jgi:hypothetical protein
MSQMSDRHELTLGGLLIAHSSSLIAARGR